MKAPSLLQELNPEHYRKHSSTQYSLAAEVIHNIAFKGYEHVLDIGCGDGRISAELAKNLPQGSVTGIDSSAAMIASAKATFPQSIYPRLRFKKMRAEEMEENASADVIVVLNALHWMRNPSLAIHKMKKALKVGGSLFILTYPQESPYWRFLEKTLQEEEWRPFLKESAAATILSSQDYKNLLVKAGFTVEMFALEEKMALYPTAEDLSQYIQGWLPCYVSLPGELEKKFLQAAIQHAQEYSLSSMEIHLPFIKLILRATL